MNIPQNHTDEPIITIENLHAGLADKEILQGISFTAKAGEIHAVMGPNGSGKSTLSKVVAGHPSYAVNSGSITYMGHDLLALSPDERSRKGVFLAFQYPQEIPGVSNLNFLRTALNAKRKENGGKDLPVLEFRKLLYQKMEMLGIDKTFATRFVNDGFSGGEKKRNEILQMAVLEPKLAILDETDSGLDVDALRIVSDGVNKIMAASSPKPAVVIITHYNRILDYIKPDFVHILHQGKIIHTGTAELALQLEAEGYDGIIAKATSAAGAASSAVDATPMFQAASN